MLQKRTKDKVVGLAVADVVVFMKMSLEPKVLALCQFDFVGPDSRNNTT